ncbi:hypothetical protein RJ639_000281 [Escallonia herrerae]|uniref:Reverse transcriptase/retrotransposon-derived protein RNase H-like domain-containing protein n=1 Tax=Escallonia herrerae TaxID=1293975 RepID=A0AA88XMX9_9ASTE|nr:hypothetical protein RJ639_000281 [Escallonia herrerae]
MKRSKPDERRPKDLDYLMPLNARPSQILHEIKDNKALKWPKKMSSLPNKRNRDLWCHFHNDHGHTTDDCGSLKRAIEALIKCGQLRKFMDDKRRATEGREEREENTGTTNNISRGLATGGSSGQAQKVYAKEMWVTSQLPSKRQKIMPLPTISFSDDDLKVVKTPHDDPLVVTIKARNFDVKRVLIDNGSSAKVLFYDAFKKMNIPTNYLRKMDMPLCGFSNHPITVEGIIALSVTIGTPLIRANLMLDFVVVKVPSAYNVILGRPAFNQLQAVVSTYHLKMKFPMEQGIGEVKGDQTVARQCYVTSCRSKNKEAFIIEDLRENTKMQRGEAVEDLVNIEVYPGEKDKIVQISSNLKENTKLELKSFEELKAYLSSPPLLSKRLPRDDLFIYLSVTEVTVNDVLVREEDGVQKPIYYVKKILQDVETRYPKVNKIAIALSHRLGISDQSLWDGSSAVGSSGAGIILISPEGFVVEYALHFGFQASNNEAGLDKLSQNILPGQNDGRTLCPSRVLDLAKTFCPEYNDGRTLCPNRVLDLAKYSTRAE